MNKKHLHLSIIALILIVSLTSCSRQNTPEFASGRFHHKEKMNKHADESTLALQQREKIEPLPSGARQDLQVSVDENQQHLTLASRSSTKKASAKKSITNDNQLISKPSTEKEPALSLNKLNPLVHNQGTQSGEQTRGKDRGDKALCAIISIFIPFLGVGLYEGIDTNFWIDLILCLLFWIPGIIFALIIILSDD